MASPIGMNIFSPADWPSFMQWETVIPITDPVSSNSAPVGNVPIQSS
jgi:hypothetical protein